MTARYHSHVSSGGEWIHRDAAKSNQASLPVSTLNSLGAEHRPNGRQDTIEEVVSQYNSNSNKATGKGSRDGRAKKGHKPDL